MPFELTLQKVIVIFNQNIRFQILVSDSNLFTIFKLCLTTIMVFLNTTCMISQMDNIILLAWKSELRLSY